MGILFNKFLEFYCNDLCIRRTLSLRNIYIRIHNKFFFCLFFFIVANNYLSLSLYIYIYIYEYFLLSSYSLTSFSSLFCCPLIVSRCKRCEGSKLPVLTPIFVFCLHVHVSLIQGLLFPCLKLQWLFFLSRSFPSTSMILMGNIFQIFMCPSR